jgi:hypothetical protein
MRQQETTFVIRHWWLWPPATQEAKIRKITSQGKWIPYVLSKISNTKKGW